MTMRARQREAPYITVAWKQRQQAGMRRAGHRPQRQSLEMLFLQVDPTRDVLVSSLQTNRVNADDKGDLLE